MSVAAEAKSDERISAAGSNTPSRPAMPAALQAVLSELTKVPGICAIALCGSRARGSATPQSDFDLMVFSQASNPVDAPTLDGALERLGSKGGRSKDQAVQELKVHGIKVELFFRELDSAEAEFQRAQQGQIRRHFNPLHTLGFLSTMLVSYVAYCRPLWDPQGLLRALMRRIRDYPEPLRRRMIQVFAQESKLALIHASKVRSADEISYLSGLYARSSAALAMILYAANGRYPMIDKDIHRLVARLPRVPEAYEERTRAIFRTAAGGDVAGAYRIAAKLHDEVVSLAAARAADVPAQAPAA